MKTNYLITTLAAINIIAISWVFIVVLIKLGDTKQNVLDSMNERQPKTIYKTNPNCPITCELSPVILHPSIGPVYVKKGVI